MKKLKVGVIGLGVGVQHALAFKKIRHCDVVSLCDKSVSHLNKIGKKFPKAKRFQSADKIINDPDIDIVSIASFDHHHFKHVTQSIKNDKHIFVEKPLCQNGDQLKKIHRALKKKRNRINLMSNMILRAAPLYQWLKKEIQKGTLGTIYSIDGDYLYGRIEKITKGWRKKVPHYSVMEGGGIHLIDLMLWLTNQRPHEVFSTGNKICTKNTAFRYPDFVQSVFQFKSGLIGRVNANFGCVHKHQHVLRVFGTRGTFIYDDRGARLHLTRNPTKKPRSITHSPLARAKGDLIPEFVKSIVNHRFPRHQIQSIFDGMMVGVISEKSLKINGKSVIPYL